MCMGGNRAFMHMELGGKNLKKVKPGQKALRIGAKLIILKLDSEIPMKNTWNQISVFEDGKTWKEEKMITW